MKQLLTTSLLALMAALPLQALALADCPAYPKAEWGSEDTLKQALKDEGYRVKFFKIDGNCYEMYGFNQAGKKVEIYFDMKTFAIIKAISLKD